MNEDHTVRKYGIIITATVTILAAIIGIIPDMLDRFERSASVAPTPNTSVIEPQSRPILPRENPTQQPSERPTQRPHPTEPSQITFSIVARLGYGQYQEVIDIYINGNYVGQLNLNAQNQNTLEAQLQITAPGPGMYNYELRSTTRAGSNMGVFDYLGYGSGYMQIVDGSLFEVVILNTFINPWAIGLQRWN